MRAFHFVVAGLVAATLLSCGDGDPVNTGPVSVTEASFGCILDLTPVRRFYVGNVEGDASRSVAVARGEAAPPYPRGTLLQLAPNAAMVKRESGFNPVGNDWEFFALEVSRDGTEIANRGNDTTNLLGGNCLDCHQVTPETDFVCESDNGCPPLGLTEAAIRVLQEADLRCE